MRHFAVAAFSLTLMTVSCRQTPASDEEAAAPASPKKEAVRHAMYIDDSSQLPLCTSDAEHWLIYVKAEKTFKTCSAGEWSNVDIKGDKGDKGDRGEVVESQSTDGRVIVDAESKVVGILLDADLQTVRLDETDFVLRLSSLETGFSKTSDFSSCVFAQLDCQGECGLPQVPLAGLSSPTTVLVPDTTKTKTMSGYFSSISEILECEQNDDGSVIQAPGGSIKVHPATKREFTLPFRYLDE